MRIAVVGAGSLGGLYGGQLARHGFDVTFIARGTTLAALRANGLTVKSRTQGDFTVAVNVTDEPASVGQVDLIVLATKTYDLESAVEAVRPVVGPETVVLTLQNGIDAAHRVDGILGGSHALTGVAYVNAAAEERGVILKITEAIDFIALGEPDGGRSDRVTQVASSLGEAGISTKTPDDVRVPMWEKFILLAGTGGVLALTRLPIGPIRESAAMSELFFGAVREAEAVGRANGIVMAPDIMEQHTKLVNSLPAESRSSMMQDVTNGRRLELDALNGAIVRLGRECGVPTPLNLAIYAGLEAYIGGTPKSAQAPVAS
jgi:2-dehydropantoate 2-reductase